MWVLLLNPTPVFISVLDECTVWRLHYLQPLNAELQDSEVHGLKARHFVVYCRPGSPLAVEQCCGMVAQFGTPVLTSRVSRKDSEVICQICSGFEICFSDLPFFLESSQMTESPFPHSESLHLLTFVLHARNHFYSEVSQVCLYARLE